MKRLLILLLAFLTQVVAEAQNPADRIVGVWLNEEQTSKIEIFKDGNSYSGKIVWLAQPNDPDGKPYLDKKNPNPEKRNQKILGLTIITGLNYAKNKWSGGTMYGPKRGQYADCSSELKGVGELQLKVSKGVFSATKTWTRK